MDPVWTKDYEALTSGRARAELAGWRAFRLTGPDRKKFLQGLVTADVAALSPGGGSSACLLTPKGMLRAQFWVYDAGDALVLICPRECVENLKADLGKMIMLSESALEELPEPLFLAKGIKGYAAARFGEGFVFDAGASSLPVAAPEAFEALRVERGWPRYGVDVDAGTIPLEAGLEDGISFTKGCYMGQETISRVHHMGHVNKLMKVVELAEKREPGAYETGKLTSVSWSPARSKWLGLATLKVSA